MNVFFLLDREKLVASSGMQDRLLQGKLAQEKDACFPLTFYFIIKMRNTDDVCAGVNTEPLLPPPLPEGPVRVRVGRPHFYTAHELALILRVTENTIYRLARRGELPSFSIGRSIRFRTQDVEEFLKQARNFGE